MQKQDQCLEVQLQANAKLTVLLLKCFFVVFFPLDAREFASGEKKLNPVRIVYPAFDYENLQLLPIVS